MPALDLSAVPAPLSRELRLAREAIEAAAADLGVDVLRRASAGRWSIAQILEHLTLAYTATAAGIDKALQSGELRVKAPVLTQTLGRVLVLDLGYFPKVPAPEMTVPCGSIPEERSVTGSREGLTLLDATLTRAAERFGEDVPVCNHPYFGGLSVRQWRKLHWRHTIHHMKQVKQRTGRS